MERHPYEGHRPGVSPICAFCRAELCESAWFKYELEKAAYVSQSPLLAPDEGDLNPVSRMTVPYCIDCRKSVTSNARQLRLQKKADERLDQQLRGFFHAIFATCFFMFASICLHTFERFFTR